MHTQRQMPQFGTCTNSALRPRSIPPHTAVFPWYEEEDYAELSAIAGHERRDYQAWYRSVMQAVDDMLREGKTIMFVTVRPAAYFAWLCDGPNTLDMHRRYAEYLVAASEVAAA